MSTFEILPFDPDGQQEIAFEPLPESVKEDDYLDAVRQLPVPTTEQIECFLDFVVDAKSWYKHLPALPPGVPMSFFLHINSGRDRLRRYGAQVLYRDRTSTTHQLHHTWMTTETYRQRFGYLAFCCGTRTEVYSDQLLEDGMATLDPNFTHPFIEGAPGELALVPESILAAGACVVTRTLHDQTRAASFARTWNRERKSIPDPGDSLAFGVARWSRIDELCHEIGELNATLHSRTGVLGRLRNWYPETKMEPFVVELEGLIAAQRGDDRLAMRAAINSMLEFSHDTPRHLH